MTGASLVKHMLQLGGDLGEIVSQQTQPSPYFQFGRNSLPTDSNFSPFSALEK